MGLIDRLRELIAAEEIGEADIDETEGGETEGTETEGDETEGDETEGDETEGGETEGGETEGDETEGDEAEGDEAEGDEGGTPADESTDTPAEAELRATITRQAAIIETLRNQVAVLGGDVTEDEITADTTGESEADVVAAFDSDYASRQALVANLLKG